MKCVSHLVLMMIEHISTARSGVLCLAMAFFWALLAGCQTAGQPAHPLQQGGAARSSANQEQPPYDPSIAFLKLSEIKPQPTPPTPGTRKDETSQRSLKQIETAQALFAEDRYTEAIQRLERALRYSPHSLRAHRLMARVCLQAGNTARAKGHLAKALQINPDSSEVHYLLGKAYAQESAWQQALTELRIVFLCSDLSQYPAVAVLAHYHLAGTLDQLGYLSAAAEEYQTFIEATQQARPDHPQSARLQSEAHDFLLSAYVKRSKLFARLGRPQQAAEALEQATTYAPQNTDLLHQMAELYMQARQYDTAAETAKRLINMDQTGLPLLISIRRRAGQAEALITDLKEMVSVHPNDYLIVEALVDSYVKSDRVAVATRILRDFVSAHPGHSKACVALADLLLRQQGWDEALELLSGAIRSASEPEIIASTWLARLREANRLEKSFDRLAAHIDQQDLDFAQAYLIGRLAQQLTRAEFAEKAFRISIEKAADFVSSYKALSQVYLDTYRWDQAVSTATRAIELDQADDEAYRLLGQAHLGLDDYDNATEALNHALRLDRSDLQAMQTLARVYELNGKALQAKRQYQMMLEIDPAQVRAIEALFLLALEDRNPDAAAQYLDSLEKLKDAPAAYRRCRAQMQVVQDGDKDRYFSTLKAIIADHPQDIETRIRLAGDCFAVGEYDLLPEQLAEILKIQPGHLQTIYWQSVLYLRDLNFDSTIEALQQLLSKHPNRVPWQQTLVAALINDQRFDAAAELLGIYLTNANLRERDQLVFQYELIMSHALSDLYEEAIATVKEWIAHDDENWYLKSMLIDLYRLAEQHAQAIQIAESWHAESTPEQLKASRAVLIDAYRAAKRFGDAEVLLLDWLEIDPDAVDATYELIHTFQMAGNLADAIDMTRAVVLGADDTWRYQFHRILGSLYETNKEYDQAIRLVRDQLRSVQDELGALAKTDPTNVLRLATLRNRLADLRARLCVLLMGAQQYDGAERELSAWEREGSDRSVQTRILQLRSLCYQLNGKGSLAIQQLEELFNLDPKEPTINNDLGYTWANQGMNLEQAEQMIRTAVGSNSRSAAYLDSLGWVLYRKGDFEGAEKWLVRAGRAPTFDSEAPTWSAWLSGTNHKRGSDDAVINDHLGDTAWRLGKKAQAVEFWERAHQLALEGTSNLQPDYKLLVQSVPNKIEAAKQDKEPNIASAVTD